MFHPSSGYSFRIRSVYRHVYGENRDEPSLIPPFCQVGPHPIGSEVWSSGSRAVCCRCVRSERPRSTVLLWLALVDVDLALRGLLKEDAPPLS